MSRSETNGEREPEVIAGSAGPGQPGPSLGWPRLQIIAAVAVLASLLIPMLITLSLQPFLLAMAAPFVIGLLVMRARPRVGIVWLGVVSLAVLLFSAPFLVDALGHPESVVDFLPLCVFTVALLVGMIAVVPSRRSRTDEASRGARTVAVAAGAVLLLACIAAVIAFAGVESVPAQPGDVDVVAEDIEFRPAAIEATAGSVSVHVTNEDNTRHTFTIEELGVDLSVPPNSEQRVSFDAEPGTYVFECLPHAPGMQGELVVR